MNLKRSMLLVVVILVAVAASWLLFRKDEPRFQGRTAQEWVRAAARKEVTLEEFDNAVDALNTNFVPVAIRHAQSVDTRMRIDRLFSRLDRWLPFDTKTFLPTQLGPERARICSSLGQLVGLVPIDSALSQINAALKKAPPAEQRALAGMIYCLVTGQEEPQHWSILQQVDNTNFTVRLMSCLFVVQEHPFLSAPGVKTKQIIAGLEHSVTNFVLMEKTFGKGARFWQRMAFTNLATASPEIAAKYQHLRKN